MEVGQAESLGLVWGDHPEHSALPPPSVLCYSLGHITESQDLQKLTKDFRLLTVTVGWGEG